MQRSARPLPQIHQSHPVHMSLDHEMLLISNIKLPIDASYEEAFSVAKKRLSRIGISSSGRRFEIYRRSVDARHRDDILFVYSVAVIGNFSDADRRRASDADLSFVSGNSVPDVIVGDEPLTDAPVIVGLGPCGLFAGLLLAERGYKPIILERGGSVAERTLAIKRFKETHVLDTETNIQYGAGGAGTFSDGKLVTRINDPLTNYVLGRFVEFGASEQIKFFAKPHIGTDVLAVVVDRIIERIEELGGRVYYHTKFLSSNVSGGKIISVNTSRGVIPAGALILAIGHSARDTYETLLSGGVAIEAKNFSVGVRIEHLADDIDRALYGKFAGHKSLGRAEYALSYDTKNRGVYTFCMCPGGEVVAATSEEFGVVVNGMSNSARSGRNSNCAVVSTVFKDDFGGTPMGAIEFQRSIERAAFKVSGDYAAPIITVGDFLNDKCIKEPSRVLPTYMDGTNVTLAHPKKYLPAFVSDGIKNAILSFDKKIAGFAADDAVITGAETRTSAPLRILRDPETRLALGTVNFYPAGEGAGYAGGITSAAIDGLKSAVALMKKYKPFGD